MGEFGVSMYCGGGIGRGGRIFLPHTKEGVFQLPFIRTQRQRKRRRLCATAVRVQHHTPPSERGEGGHKEESIAR